MSECESLWVFRACSSVNLSTRIDTSRGKYRRVSHNGYSVLVHLSTCLPGLTVLEVEEMVIHCVWLLAVSKTAHCSQSILASLHAS